MQSISEHITIKYHSGAQTAGCTAAKKVACAAQVVDEQQGPRTRKEYTIATVPVGAGGAGQVVDFLIRPLDAQLKVVSPNGASLRAATAPLLGTAPDMDAREQICEPLTTGVKVRVGKKTQNLNSAGHPAGHGRAGADLRAAHDRREGGAASGCAPCALL